LRGASPMFTRWRHLKRDRQSRFERRRSTFTVFRIGKNLFMTVADVLGCGIAHLSAHAQMHVTVLHRVAPANAILLRMSPLAPQVAIASDLPSVALRARPGPVPSSHESVVLVSPKATAPGLRCPLRVNHGPCLSPREVNPVWTCPKSDLNRTPLA
jgi:hypothetical protein